MRSERPRGPLGLRRRGASSAFRCVLLASFALATSGASALRAADAPPAKTDAVVGVPSDGAARSRTATRTAPDTTVAGTASTGALDLGPSVLKSAVDAADADYARTDSRSTFGAVSTSQGTAVEPAFKAAEIDTCGRPQGALKFDPPVIGPVPLGGLLVAPYWLHAVTTGRCGL